MFNFPTPYEIGIMLPAVVIGLTFHEYAHAWAADKLGDPTARYMGRLTINPISHVDPIGLLMLFFAGFGWAKPVPVTPYRLTGSMRRSLMLVSIAGPATNMIIAITASLLFGLAATFNSVPLIEIMKNIITINVVLAVFNLLPVPPLDGSKILAGILPGEQRWLDYMEQYGTIILLLLLFTGILSPILWTIISPILSLMNDIVYFSNSIFLY
ncbi:Zn-dependent protease [Desulfohalotomaculum tongense]|uniref:site-2 protease family protein n=1 Tax=Desulforadius tongensis TaxID=1216062 RepID=UPI00195BF1FD|nr:Zn-dependent protease [Desulforadius tongensis]